MEGTTNCFTFETRPNAKELWLFSMHYANQSYRGLVNLILVGGAALLLITRFQTLTMMQKLLLAFIMFLFVVWQPGTLYLKAMHQAKNLETQPPLTLTFSAEGVNIAQGDQSGKIEWKNMGKVERVQDMIIVYSDNIHASLLPKRIMGDQEEGFRALLKTCMPKGKLKRI